jgi:hypothetical protein
MQLLEHRKEVTEMSKVYSDCVTTASAAEGPVPTGIACSGSLSRTARTDLSVRWQPS